METYDGVIEEWYFINGCIYGSIYTDGKDRFVDGTDIKTSRVLNPEEVDEYTVIETRNSLYLLGAEAEDVYDH